MSATCPACGVAVVPGYVRCPKCQRPLPSKGRGGTVAGGTAVAGGGGLPLIPIAAAVAVVLGVILFFALRGGETKPASAQSAPDEMGEQPADDTPEPVLNNVPTIDEPRPGEPPRVDPNATARDLERALKSQRLWSSVEVVGNRVEVRSGSCRDANMIPAVDAARSALRTAGLTKVRCVENSGAVVFEREL